MGGAEALNGTLGCMCLWQGFRKTETELWQFANPYFVRGKKELLSNIVRHKAEINRNKREREPQAMVKQEV